MHSPKISVIIPVYNAEKYIRKCLDSIINQTFTDFEVLIIDDGSLDKSGIICDEYSNHDRRIHVFHQKNKGVSIARQLGMDKAQTQYIIHADPDDFVEPQWLELLYNKAIETNADITICNYNNINNNIYKTIKNPQNTNNIECLKLLMKGDITGQLWNKLIQRKLFAKHNIRITPGLDFREDSSIMYPAMFYANSIAFVNEPLYNYRNDNKNSYINNLTKRPYQEDLYLFVQEMDTFKNTHIKDPSVLDCFIYQKLAILGYLLIKGDYDLIIKNKPLYNDINFSTLKLCPYNFYKPVFILLIFKLYSLIPVYRKLLGIYHK